MAKKPRFTNNTVENRMVRNLDDLAEFEDYVGSVLPKIRQLRKKGKTAKQIYDLFKDDFAARKVSIALDPSVAPEKALAAMNSLEDRIDGKPKERKELDHKYAQMPDKQIDSLLLSELSDSDSPAQEEEGSSEQVELQRDKTDGTDE